MRTRTGLVPILLLLLSCKSPQAAVPADAQDPRPEANRPRNDRKVAHAHAVLDGLRWLARHQAGDGSWSPRKLVERCAPGAPCAARDRHWAKAAWTDHYDVGLTGLALLAFLGAGVTPDSGLPLVDPVDGTEREAGAVVELGLRWLQARQAEDGRFTPERAFLYNEAVATLAMVEAWRLTRDEEWKVAAQKGLDFLQAAQRPSPTGTGPWGWRYASRQEVEKNRRSGALEQDFQRELFDSDTSITGWAALCLSTARAAGLDVSQASIDGALAFTRWVSAENGLVGYLDPKGAGATVTGPNDHFAYHPATMSAIAMGTRISLAQEPREGFVEQAAKRLENDPPAVSADRLSVDYYYWNCAARALKLARGSRRSAWNEAAAGVLIELQDRTAGACSQGGWVVADRWSYTGGPVYTTAINVLTLQTIGPVAGSPAARPGPPPAVIDRVPLDFRLADERGKVVVLACLSPLTKTYSSDSESGAKLSSRFATRPFTYAEVVYDPRADRESGGRTVVKALDHPLLASNDVQSFPTVLVFDADGVLRARDPTWEEAGALLERLVAEAEDRPKPR